jgi:arylsulfatase A-like enzyme
VSDPQKSSALVARLVAAGMLGGVVAGVAELIGAAPGGGPLFRTALFLATLDGAAGATAGLLLGLIVAGLARATDLGALAAVSAGRPAVREKGAALVGYGIGIVAALLLIGFGVRAVTTNALLFFHHRGLIAALVGAAAAGLALAGLFVVVPLVAAALKWLPGRRLDTSRATPVALWTALALLGLLGGGGAVSLFMLSLQERPRMTASLRALNAGLWSPALVGGVLVVALVAAHFVGRRLTAPRWRRPAMAVLLGMLALMVPIAGVISAAWPTVRQLDRRPFIAGVTLLVVATAALVTGYGARFQSWRRSARVVYCLAVPVILLVAALGLGRAAATRKVAARAGLAPLVTRGVQLVADFDRDGFSSVLGGGDCDDFDPDVHPGAFDWPDDGIDQNCNGHQATLAAPPPRHYAAVPPSVPEKPNVILITIDALRADHMGAWGYRRPTTPALDALAAESTRFSRAFSHAPSTRYSVPAILTGRYPSQIAVNNDPRNHWPPQVLPENRLVAEILKDLGYFTGATLSYYYFERGWGLDQGFDDYDYHLYTLHSVGGNPAATSGTSARELADLDISWLQKRDTSRPFFLWTHFYDTHFMFQPHPDLPESNFGRDEIALYDGEIRFTDFHVGRVLAELKRLGLWEKTIVIVTSDHGDGFGEHGLPQSERHGYHLYTNETFVPLIVHVPGIAPRVVDVPASHIDILPTLLNALRQPAEAEPQLLGQSLFGLMLGETTPPPPVDPELGRLVFQEVWYEGPTSRKAVLASGWHGIYNVVPSDTRELFDLKSDFAEEHDLAGEGLAVEERLWNALGAWMDQAALPPEFATRAAGRVLKTAPPVEIPLGDKIGGFLVLDGMSSPVVKDNVLRFDLIMHATARPPTGWRRFMHLFAASGRQQNADEEPLAGLYPLTRMRPGTWLRDAVEIRLPAGWPRGPASIDIGAFRGAERAKVEGPHARPDNSIRIPVSVQ